MTQPSDVELVEQIVDTERYPLTEPGSAAWRAASAGVRRELAETGCSVLAGFVADAPAAALGAECASLAGSAYDEEQKVNVYNTDVDAALPADHPGRRIMVRGNSFVPRDRIPEAHLVHRLYVSPLFQRFLADCLDLPAVHPLADPLAGLCLNIVAPGREHPWHFDTNEFAVSMVTQQPEDGGIFQYCPNIRSPRAENFADVRAVLDGDGAHLVHSLPLRTGDLQLFRGRHSLHRVATVRGRTARHSAIFAYSAQAGVVGSAERTRQLFGRVLPAHTAGAARPDDLLD